MTTLEYGRRILLRNGEAFTVRAVVEIAPNEVPDSELHHLMEFVDMHCNDQKADLHDRARRGD